jgi:hypothetical protein
MTWPARTEGMKEMNMKITVVKKGSTKAKPSGWCPVLVDDIDAGMSK